MDLQLWTNAGEKLQFSCEIEHYGKGSISIFPKSFASIGQTYILEGRLGGGLQFYQIFRFS